MAEGGPLSALGGNELLNIFCAQISQSVRPEKRRHRHQYAFSVLVSGCQFVSAAVVEMALNTCEQFLSVLDHCDIDVSEETPPGALAQHWAQFLHDYYMVAQ